MPLCGNISLCGNLSMNKCNLNLSKSKSDSDIRSSPENKYTFNIDNRNTRRRCDMFKQ